MSGHTEGPWDWFGNAAEINAACDDIDAGVQQMKDAWAKWDAYRAQCLAEEADRAIEERWA